MTATLKVLVCNEHFQARIGVERIPMRLAEHLQQLGMEISFACLRYDRVALDGVAETVHQIDIPDGLDAVSADEHVSAQMGQIWRDAAPDVVLSGGWPFFGAVALAQTFGAKGIFIDAGTVPHEGLLDSALATQQGLKRLRERTLPAIDLVLPISDFIRGAQSEPDRGSDRGVHTVLLGADHLVEYRPNPGSVSEGERAMLQKLEARIADGARILLALGRYEHWGYKNSAAVFRIFEALRPDHPDLHLVVLIGDGAVAPPKALASAVTLVSSIGDAALQELISLCVLGLSLSRWEGFSLPLAEMQWLGKPALAFNLGANPEIVAHPWLLADTGTEMREKAKALLRGDDPLGGRWSDLVQRFRQRSQWKDVFDRWATFIADPRRSAPTLAPAPRMTFVDVSNSGRDPTDYGALRVSRRILAQLQQRPELDLVFVCWDNGDREYRLLSPSQRASLGSNAGPIDHLGLALGEASPSVDLLLRRVDPPACKPVLFLPEPINDEAAEARLDWAETRGIPSAAIVDLPPVPTPDVLAPSPASVWPAYVRGLRRVDELWSLSQFSQDEFERHTGWQGAEKPKRAIIGLPGQFSDCPRADHSPPEDRIEILCVSAIEPRNNQRTLIEGFLQLLRARPQLEAQLVLVGGGSDTGGDNLVAWIRHIVAQERRITWRGALSDAKLADQYRRSAFTVYPSFSAGFGSPIMESLWMGAPCLCHHGGAMAELAVGGGCLTVDMSDARQIADGLDMLLAEAELRQALRRQAAARSLVGWDDYTVSVARRLQSVGV